MHAKRIISLIILVPIAVILIALSVANRESVTLTIDPFNPGNPALSYHAPFFIWLMAMLVIGVVIGSIITWAAQGKHRRHARKYKQEAAQLLERAEMAEKRSIAKISAHL